MLDAIKGEVRIFIKEFKDNKSVISCCVGGRKEKDGTYTNIYFPVNFTKNVDTKSIKNETDILIKKAWISCYIKDDERKPLLIIDECKIVK